MKQARALHAITAGAALSLALLGAACTTSFVSSTPGSSGDGGSSGVGDGGAAGGLPSSLPAPCDPEQSPETNRACTDALAAVCATFDAEAPCAARTFPYQDIGYTAGCEWVEFRHVTDASTCTTDASTYRCLAFYFEYDTFVGVPDPFRCEVGSGQTADWSVDDADQLLMKAAITPILPSTSTQQYDFCVEFDHPDSTSPLCGCTDCTMPLTGARNR